MESADYVRRFKDRTVVGFVEWVICFSKSKRKFKEVKARVDTGATKSSIDINLAKELGLGPVIGNKTIKNAHGSVKRDLIEVTIKIAGNIMKEKFTLADRTDLRYPILIGRNILQHNFLIDPKKRLIKKEAKK